MSNRDTFDSSIKSAEKAKLAQGLIDANSEQETIAANRHNVGYTTQSGNFANLDTATKAANLARFNNALAREKTKQATILTARDTLRGTGDVGPT